MFWQMILIEQTKLFKRAILWVELGLLALTAVIINLVLYAVIRLGTGAEAAEVATQLQPMLTWPGALINGIDLAIGPGLGGMIIIILVVAITAQEYTWRTLQLWLSRGVPRATVMGAKFASLLLPALLMVLAPLIVTALVTAVLSYLLTGVVAVNEVNWLQVGMAIPRTALTLLPYAAFGFLLAVASRSTVVATGIGLAYTLLIENIALQLLTLIGGTPARIAQFLPGGLAQSLRLLNSQIAYTTTGSDTADMMMVEPATAVVGMLLYSLLFVGLAILIFRRQDLGG
jgi:ABC-type transport system involved in multi-copper enzyme maturation permease subunit